MVVTDLDRQGLLSIDQNCGIARHDPSSVQYH